MFCVKVDYQEAQLTHVERIAERDVAGGNRWPNVKILRTQRDCDSDFKSVRARPDMCAILRTEFAATWFGIQDENDTVLFMYLALPFGRRANPGYFSRLGDGAEYFSPQLFMGDAIFIEPDVGKRHALVI